MSDAADRVTVYADYVCPFCYLGHRSLEAYRASRDTPLSVEWHPFDLRASNRGPDGEIDPSIDDGKDEAYFEQAKRNVERLRTQYGAEDMLDIDDVPEVDSFDAQVVSFTIQERDPKRWPAFDTGVYRALWEDGLDIGDEAALVELAERAGVDGEVVTTALASDERIEALETAFRAAQRQRITGVPTFVADGQARRGAVPPSELATLFASE